MHHIVWQGHFRAEPRSRGAALRIHIELGPGLIESVYEAVLARAIEQKGFPVQRQRVIRFEYQGMVFEEGFRVDLIVMVGSSWR